MAADDFPRDTDARLGIVPHLLATGFYSGYSPVAPGTAGTLVAIPLAPLITAVADVHVIAYLAVLVLSIAGAVWAAQAMVDHLGVKDPGTIVCDEIVGYFVALAFIPIGWGTLLAAFLWFRLFDIIKPPPARQLEALPGGYGVVMDDVMAGIYANLAVRLCVAAGMPVL